MKVLIICKFGNDIKNNKLDRLNNISSVYGYFFYHNLKKFAQKFNFELDLDIIDLHNDYKNLPQYNHCFYLYNRGISLLNEKEYQILKSKITDKIFTIAPTSKYQGNEDYLLFFAGKQKERTLRINLVSDETELIPLQDNKKITILVDHEYYGDENSRLFKIDQTFEIIQSLLEFKKKWKGKPIEIIQINTGVPEGFSIINTLDDAKHYDRLKATSFKNIYKIYCKSDMFIVTHPEALGLSCVECNQAGCKVISPDGFIKPEFGKFLDIVYVKDKDWKWEDIINSLDNKKTKFKVRHLTFQKALSYIFKKCKL
jgi:hypothetical protein